MEQPDGLEELEPLYRAVVHGCRAQLFDAALNRVFENRIRRGDECFSLLQLGAVSADLSTLAGFFPFGWSSPPATGDLSERDRSWLIGEVAFCLMFLSRIELTQPTPAPATAEPIPEAARAWAQADNIIRHTGYGRRETELHLLEARLRHHQCRPDQARETLARAQSRIRTIGQCGLWPRLTLVAAELGIQVPDQY